MNCRYCNLPGSDTTTHSYWSATVFPCHRACKDAGVKREAYECQCIDADCNDCKHYQRGRLATAVISEDGRKHQPNVFIGGHCLKFDRPAIAQPNKWSGLECFEHRRTP